METTTQIRIPIGQQLLKAGFPEITPQEIHERLKCDEIAKMENDLIRQQAQEHCDQLNKKRRFKCIVVQRSNAYHIEYPPTKFTSVIKNAILPEPREEFHMADCNSKYITLELYAKQEIPEQSLLKLEQARQIGLSHFWVAYPELRPKGDPIIIGKVSKDDHTRFFVCQW